MDIGITMAMDRLSFAILERTRRKGLLIAMHAKLDLPHTPAHQMNRSASCARKIRLRTFNFAS